MVSIVEGVLYLLQIGCLLTWLSMKCSIDVLCVIALLYQALERCRRRCLMNGKFPNLVTFALDMWVQEGPGPGCF